MSSRARGALTACAGYLAAAALSMLILVRIMKLWQADLSIPMRHFWDALLTQMWVKGVFENGWYLHNPNLGAPTGMDMHDFPMADSLHFFLLKLLCLASPNYAVAFNLYYLLGFPLATVSMLFVLRRFSVSYPAALTTSLLFAFLPYHFVRGQQHLFLASYYVVPLSTMVALWLYLGRIGGAEERSDSRGRWIGSLAIAVLQSCAGVYYAAFACFLLLVAGLAAALDTRRFKPLAVAALLFGVTTAGVLANLSPSLLYWREHGRNRSVARRDALEADIHGLKIGQLLLPDSQHRIGRFARVRKKYDSWPLADGEKIGATLGVVGGVGFLVLIGALLRRREEGPQPSVLSGLAVMNIFSVLLATIGGFGSLFNFLIFAQIRCYNRISIYIAMFSLFAVALLLDRFAAGWLGAGRRKWQLATLLAALLAVGVVDEAGRGRVPDYAGLKADFENDAEFVRRIEAAVPTGAMIFQLPYFPFPEAPHIVELGDYEEFRPYFHSRSLRWSYGAMKGRDDDKWQSEVSERPRAEFVQAIAERGFAGIYIDRLGYADRAVALEAELTDILGRPPLVSGNIRMSFFPLPQAKAAQKTDRTVGQTASASNRRG
ncbi:MAG TPA: hypothetical protein VHC19_26630 [Pirellulales bacterium]|nr:hypothetical protein [Pirellulales bacterium]